jgi:Fe-S oxidoreductase
MSAPVAAKPISYLPTDGLSYDPTDPKYWQPELLEKEVIRAFEICHGCRMCFKYCDSFPTLFSLIDDKHDGDVTRLSHAEKRQVMDACFQCKLCEVQCPYTPRDKHEFQLDFPKLVHRWAALHQSHEPGTLRDRVLADPDGSAKFARLSLGLANAMNKVPLHRALMEVVLGIHRDKLLPDFAAETFDRWAEKSGKVAGPGAEAVLFQTCYVQNNEPQIGRDTVEVMEKNGVQLACTAGLGCCGMPSWERGDLETLRERARHNLERLMPYVDAGAKVLVINPTCSMMMRREYPELLEGEQRRQAERLSAAVRDCGEYLWSIRNEPRFNTNFRSTPGPKVAYHAPCHLRAQGIGFKGRDLLRKIPGVVPSTVMECCGHDGTYAMKVESFEASAKVGARAFEGMSSAQAEVWSTECPLAALQFQQHAGTKPLHPMTILARAYRPDGFPTSLPGADPTKEESH